MLGMRVTEQIVFDEGEEMGAWLAATMKSYDVAFTRDHRQGPMAAFITSPMQWIAAKTCYAPPMCSPRTVFSSRLVLISTVSGRHFFLYFYEPGGNRFEVGAGGYLIFDPDWQPVVWSREERMKGQAWGLQTVTTFHTYGTPPVDDQGEK